MKKEEKILSPKMTKRNIRMMNFKKPKDTKGTVIRLWGLLSGQRIKLIIVAIFVILSTILTLLGTRFIGIAIDNFIAINNFDGLLKLLIILIAIYISSAVLNRIQLLLSVKISQNVVTNLRKLLFEKFQTLPLKFFDTTSHGDLMSRATNDVDTIATSLNTNLSQAISSLITILGSLFFMITLSPILTLVALISIPILFLITSFITKRSKKYFKNQQNVLGDLNGKIEEIISSQKVVKIFVKENDEIKEFENLNKKLNKAGVKAQIFSGLMGPVSTLINGINYALISCVGAILAINKMITIGDITSFVMYTKQFARPFNELANQYNMLILAIVGAERVFEILDQPPEPDDAKNAVTLKDIKGEVSFNDVTFSYNEEKIVLKNINLTAKPGQTIALVGPTGAGKTTIINLLTRFYDIQQGEISIDGINITNIKRNSLRKSLGIVLQDTYLFTGTIKDNIKYGRLNAADGEIKEAAILANAHEFIHRLPNGYDTILTEDDDTLSQGQKQMIAIARAILADPSILILDEATSNVDTRTEVKIQKAMLNLMDGRTSFVIAHRLSTIRNADLIAVINDGRIIEQGNHKELIIKKGFYYNLYMNQFSD